MNIIVTGGAGFIGSALVRHLILNSEDTVTNIDKLTYAGSVESLAAVAASPRYQFEQVDICDRDEVRRVFEASAPDAIVHLAAETHVDRSIDDPGEFLRSNITGTFTLLEAARDYWNLLGARGKERFRFLHVSTDEVFGELCDNDAPFSETANYAPSSPYSASKASADHLVRAWHRTYGLPTLITNCSNNYGPYHYPEKFIPVIIRNALEGKALPIYGDGRQIRDWLYVEDHVAALHRVLTEGRCGESYNIGGGNERRNIDVAHAICQILEELAPEKPQGVKAYADLITQVTDRPGHDYRYAIDSSKIMRDVGWKPGESFESGLRKTVTWYLENFDWIRRVESE